ncbi:efflux RND transporter periplasmic adaptor subunit [candidate division FCPU426 bacterium]|nr:efflux RND transporter periplasmic adaptor subunit [candidate division FCPU426 bacterium]
MNKYISITVFLAGIAAAGMAINGCTAPKTGQIEQALYQCPMHPAVISDRPGSCRICGMDLVPVKKPAGPEEKDSQIQHETTKAKHGKHTGMHPEGYSKINISPEKQQLIGVRLAKVEQAALIKTIHVAGEVAHDPDMYQAQAEYLKTKGYGGDTGLHSATRLKLEHMGMSPELIRALERRGEAKRNLIVESRDYHFWIYVYFYESDLPYIKTGQEVTITVPVLNNMKYPGTLKALRSYIDTRTRSIRGIVEVEDRNYHLRPGLFVNAAVEAVLPETAVMPLSAVLDSGERRLVFVKTGNGIFHPRQVEVGAVAQEQVQVLSGVAPGEEVVVSANFMLDSESRLQAALESAAQPAGHQH